MPNFAIMSGRKVIAWVKKDKEITFDGAKLDDKTKEAASKMINENAVQQYDIPYPIPGTKYALTKDLS